MDLPFTVIKIETLMERWKMSKMDVFQIVLNHNIIPVYKDHPESNWTKYDLEQAIYLFTWPEEYGDKPIIFKMSDIDNLKKKLGGKVSKSNSIISDEELCKRWNISMNEIWDITENYNLDVVDPLNLKVNDYRGLSLEQLVKSPWYDNGMTKYFSISDVEDLEKKFPDLTPNTTVPSRKKLRPNQLAKLECRKIAKKIWDNNRDITIAKMISLKEIREVCRKRDGSYYVEKSIREWIKDLCPNRTPGRPRKKN